MATYNVEISSKAIRSFSDLSKQLVTAHRKWDPSTPVSAIKIITHFLHNSHGNWLYVGTSTDEMSHRFIRVIIDIPAGSKTAAEKEGLMRSALDCCIDYEGKKAKGCEYEVRINEIQPENVMRIDAQP